MYMSLFGEEIWVRSKRMFGWEKVQGGESVKIGWSYERFLKWEFELVMNMFVSASRKKSRIREKDWIIDG